MSEVIVGGPYLVTCGLVANAWRAELEPFPPANSGTAQAQFILAGACFAAFDALDALSLDLSGFNLSTGDVETASDNYLRLGQVLVDALGDGSPTGPIVRQSIPDVDSTLTLPNWLYAAKGNVTLPNGTVIAREDAYTSSPALAAIRDGWVSCAPDAPRWGDQALTLSVSDDQRPGKPQAWTKLRDAIRRSMVRGRNIGDQRDVFDLLPGVPVFEVPGTYCTSSRAIGRQAPSGVDPALSGYGFWTRDQATGELVGSIPADVDAAEGLTNAAWAQGLAGWTPTSDPDGWYTENIPDHAPASVEGSPYCVRRNKPGVTVSNLENNYWFKVDTPGMSVTAVMMVRGIGDENTGGAAVLLVWRDGVGNNLKIDTGNLVRWGENKPSSVTSTAPAGAATGTFVISTGSPDGIGYFTFGPCFWSYQSPFGAAAKIARRFDDQWRTQTVYQDPDQYLYLEMSVLSSRSGEKSLRLYVSATTNDDPAQTWTVDLTQVEGFQIDGSVAGYKLRPSALLNNVTGEGFPIGTAVKDFGLISRIGSDHTIRIRHLRFLSGPDQQWVDDHLQRAIHGAALPYFPGAAPYLIGLDTVGQVFYGYNGSPPSGYQLPDYWIDCAVAVAEEFPGLSPADLPVAGADGSIQHPLSATTAGGIAKPGHVLLAEQQLRYLTDARGAYSAAHAVTGPFAFTFALNTSARANLGNPAPHTWTSASDLTRPAWMGYQARPVESMAVLAYRTAGNPAWADARGIAIGLARDWLIWLDSVWASNAAIPSDLGADGVPTAGYEDIGLLALVLRACVTLKRTGEVHAAYDSLIDKSWTRLEANWKSSGPMRYTWSPNAAAGSWYGLWQGEAVQTLATVLDASNHPGAVPSTVPVATVAARLVLASRWLAQSGTYFCDTQDAGSTLPIWTRRINWSQGVTETLEWATDIMASRTGSEQRREIRLSPRRMVEATYHGERGERTRLDLAVRVVGGGNWLFPMWQDQQSLGADALEGAVRLRLDPTARDYHSDGYALLLGDTMTQFERVKVVSLGDGFVRLASPLLARWPKGTRVYPMRIGRFTDQPEVTRSRDDTSVVQARFEVQEFNDYPGQEWLPERTYEGYAVWDYDQDESEEAKFGYERNINTLDNKTGIPVYRDLSDRAFGTQTYRFWLYQPEGQAFIRSFLYYLRGRLKAIWLPTFFQDLIVSASCPAGTHQLYVENCGYTAYDGLDQYGRIDVRIEMYDRTVFFAKIVGASEVDEAQEELTLDTALPVELNPTNVRRISFMALSRGMSDSVEIQHETGTDGVSTSAVTFRNTYETRIAGLAMSPSLPIGYVGVAYDGKIVVKGGTAPISFYDFGGVLPPGLAFTPDGSTNRRLSGMPSQAGLFAFNVRAQDSNGLVSARTYKVRVIPGPLKVTGDLPDLTLGDSVGYQYLATGGYTPYRYFKVIDGYLPAGLTMDETGHVTGVASAAGYYTWAVRVTDAEGRIADVRDDCGVYLHLTSTPYPVLILEGMQPAGTLVRGFEFRAPIEGVKPVAALVDGTLKVAVTYENIDAGTEGIQPVSMLLDGELKTVVSYGNADAGTEGIQPVSTIIGGSLVVTTGYIYYTIKPTEGIKPSATIQAGTLK